MPVPPLPSNLINTRNIFDICIKLRQEVDELDPRRPIVKCCYKIGMAINNAINEPAFDADGRVNLRAVKALVDAESEYLKSVVTECHPRCFAFEQVFREIRAAIHTMPGPQAPTVTCVPAMDRMAEYRFEKVTLIKSNLQKCKEQVRKAGPLPPKVPVDIKELRNDPFVRACEKLLHIAYHRFEADNQTPRALRLLAPHLYNPLFRSYIFSIYVTEVYLSGHATFPSITALLEAHELSLPDRIGPTITIGALNPKAGARLCDMLPSIYTYVPLRDVRTYFPGGRRLDYDVHTTSRHLQHIVKTMTDRISWDSDYYETTFKTKHDQRLCVIQSLKTSRDCEHVLELLAILGEHTMLEEAHQLRFQTHLLALVGWMGKFYYGARSH